MESKLLQAATMLPEPASTFAAIERAAGANAYHKPRRMTRIVLAAALILCLCITAFAYGSRSYGLWSGLYSTGYGDVMLLNWKYDYSFPEDFMGLPFTDVSTLYGAPHGATHLEAILKPTYIYHSLSYGDQTGTHQQDGTTIYNGQRIHIGFGSNQGENWKYHFSVGEDGFCNYEGAIPGSQWKMEYEGFSLYICSHAESHHVRWEDGERNMVLRLSCYGFETQEEAVEVAKAMIDQNQ